MGWIGLLPSVWAQPISPMLCGQNAWMPSGYDCDQTVGTTCASASGHISRGGKLDAFWPLLEQSAVRVVRIGGNDYNSSPPTPQQYLAWVDQIRGIGAEPIVQVPNAVSATWAGSLVRSLNVTGGRAVKYWSIGNEPDLHGFGSTAVATYVRSLSSAMKVVDASIVVFAPETAWYDHAVLDPLLGGADDITGTDAAGHPYVDVVSFHRYPFGASYSRASAVGATAGLATAAADLSQRLAVLNASRGASPLRWALTEFNLTTSNPDPSAVGIGVPSFLNGQHFAEVFAVGMQYQALCMNTWSVEEGGGSGGPSDLGYLDGSGVPRSSWHHLRMVSESFAGQFAAGTASPAGTLVKVFGSRSATRIVAMILNEESATAYDFNLKLGTGTVTGTAALKLTVDAGLTVEHADTIAAQSTLLLVFGPQGNLLARTRYAVADAQAARAPTTETFGGDVASIHGGTLTIAPDPVARGQTVTGTSTLMNVDPVNSVSLLDAVVAARPPGGTHGSGPFLDIGKTGPLTLAPSETLPVSQSRWVTPTDPTGAWYAYLTVRAMDGTWHDLGADLPFAVVDALDAGPAAGDVGLPDAAAGDSSVIAADASGEDSGRVIGADTARGDAAPGDASGTTVGAGCGCQAGGASGATVVGAALVWCISSRRRR